MSRLFAFLGTLTATALLSYGWLQAADAPPTLTPANVSAIQQLKPVKGRELILANCIPCHSTAVIAASHLNREKWDQTITKMQKQNGLWPLMPAIRNQILDYLETTQPPSDPGLEKAKESQWGSPLYRPNPIW